MKVTMQKTVQNVQQLKYKFWMVRLKLVHNKSIANCNLDGLGR